MEKINEIDYADLVDLGFTKIVSHDEVWEDQYGYPYFIMTLTIDNERWCFDWTPDTRKVSLGKNFKPMKDNLTLDEVRWFIELLTPPQYKNS